VQKSELPPLFCGPLGNSNTKSSRRRRIAVKARRLDRTWTGEKQGYQKLAYKMVAERENETVRVERQSRLMIAAKAKIFASEGWKVVVIDGEGKSYEPPEFEKLLAA
jgi:hypothetical protein